ncbi:hypothetical protein [Sphingomonas panaciterrae]|uniref:hypothetical protein n=1 Tax=Sphingomonas panaciterrae TaxID=1462999 RepID=UPI002FF04A22
MADKLSTDAIAIVASNLTVAHFSTGTVRIDESDVVGSVLNVYWTYCGELEEQKSQDGARDR